MSIELDRLEIAVKAPRYDGRIKAIKKLFKEYKESLVVTSRWQKLKRWFTTTTVITIREEEK